MVEERLDFDFDKISEDVIRAKPKFTHEKQTQGQLVTAIADEIRNLVKDIPFPGKDGTYKTMTVYEQMEPYYEDDEDEDDKYPYCVVKYVSSKITGISQREEVTIVAGFGIMYEEADRQYAPYFYHIFNLIRKRFISDNFLNNFRCEPEMSFALSDNDDIRYPYYFGAVYMKWMIPGIDSEIDFWP